MRSSRKNRPKAGDRLEFEMLISDLSARFIRAEGEDFEQEIERALGRVRDHFRGGNCGLLEVDEERGVVRVRWAVYANAFEPVPAEVNLSLLFPNAYAKLMRGEANVVRRTSDVASPDREQYERMGTRSTLDIPVQIGGSIRFFLVLNAVDHEVDWPEEYIPRLQLLGEVFVNALERRRSEALLRESEARLRLAAEAAGAGFWSLDPATGTFWATETGLRLFRWTDRQRVDVELFLELVHPEDVRGVRAALENAIQHGKEIDIEYRIVLREVGERWIASRGLPYEVRGVGKEILGVSFDVTERKRGELRVATAASVARFGIYEVWWEEKRVLLDERVKELLGIPPEEERRTPEYWLERVHPEDLPRVLSFRGRLQDGESGPETVEYRYAHPQRGELWFRHAARLLARDAAGRGVHSLGVLHEVTEQKRAEEELRRSLEEVRRLRDEAQRQNAYLREQIRGELGGGAIVGRSPAVQLMLAHARRVAPTDTGVLITGETGTGKELLAEAIHEMSERNTKPMVKVNCAALPATLIESELFGHRKGAYTGAITDRTGRFELADGSTLFLDEVSELPLELQAKLLRVLQEGQFERLGDARTIRVNVRVIAGTNRDLASLVQQGRFRADLFYRLNVFPIEVPPLRNRQGDIPLLVRHFVTHFSEKMGKRIETIPPKTFEDLERHPWPGNIRELRNLIERSVIMGEGSTLRVEFPSNGASEGDSEALEVVERRHILRVLERTGWRISGPKGAANRLGLIPTTLHSKLKKLKIYRPEPS